MMWHYGRNYIIGCDNDSYQQTLGTKRQKYFLREQKSNQAPFKISIYTILEFHLYW